MSRKLKLVEMDFTMTILEPVEQVKAMEVMIMTVLFITQNLPDNHRNLSARAGVRSHHPAGEDAPSVSRETIVNNQHHHCENDKARRMAPMPKQIWQIPRTDRITRSQVRISANISIIMAKTLALTSINSDLLTNAEAIDSTRRYGSKRAMEEECTSILLNNTLTTINSQEARQLRVKPIGSKWVYKTKHNPNSTI